jgi:hypothetical protein
LSAWLAEHPEIVVKKCRVHVPAINGLNVQAIEFGLHDVPQFGVVWWGDEAVSDQQAEVYAEPGTSLAVVGKIAGGGVAIGSCALLGAEGSRVEWCRSLPGVHDVDVVVDVAAAPGARQLEVQAVPILESGARVHSRRAWRMGKGLVKSADVRSLSVRLSGLAAGRYELQVVDGRRIVANAEATIPGSVPVMTLHSQASVVFALPQSGLPHEQTEVCYVRQGGGDTPSVARLPTGLLGFEGFGLQGVPAGDYVFCLRCRDRYAEGRFRVDVGARVVYVPIDQESIEWIDGHVDGVDAGHPCVVSVVSPHVPAPWMWVQTDEHGKFRLGIPLRYIDRGLIGRWGGESAQLQQTSVGRWARQQ